MLGDPTYRVRYELFDLVSDLPEALKSSGLAVTAAQSGDGVLWFLASGGLVRVDPRQIVRNAVPPPVRVRSVTADDKAYSPRGVVSLPPLTRTLRIDYTALSLTIPERVNFRYRLEGWESDWHEAGTRRTVFYTDLKPGHYAFRVLAANNDGVWNETGATLAFTVAPAWYQTMWFQVTVVAGLAASVALLYRCACAACPRRSARASTNGSRSARGSRASCTTRCCRRCRAARWSPTMRSIAGTTPIISAAQ